MSLPMVFEIVVIFVNGSSNKIPFSNALEARHYAKDKISYSGGRVWQVELREIGKDSGEVLWNYDWDEVSKAAGLTITF